MRSILEMLRGKSAEGAQPASSSADMLRFVWWRNAWNMDVSVKALTVAMLAVIVSIVAVVGDVIAIYRDPHSYFAVTPDGRVIPIQPLSSPLLTDAQVLSLAQSIAVDAYSFDFANWRTSMNRVSSHFNQKAWEQWMSSMQQNGVLDAVVRQKMVVSATPTSTPVKVGTAMVAGSYAWKIQIPLLVTYASANDATTQQLVVTMVLRRAPLAVHEDGAEVIQMVASMENGNAQQR